jgi:hypothetical protein
MIYYCRPKVVSITNSHAEVKLKLRRRTKNHLNSMYFGTLAVGSDITCGVLAMKKIRESNKNISLIFKDFLANFKMRAEGDVHFYCGDGEKIDQLVSLAVSTSERVNEKINITAKVPSISNEVVAEFSETLSLKQQ